MSPDALERLNRLLKLIVVDTLRIFPPLAVILLTVLAAILAFLAIFSELFFPSKIPGFS